MRVASKDANPVRIRSRFSASLRLIPRWLALVIATMLFACTNGGVNISGSQTGSEAPINNPDPSNGDTNPGSAPDSSPQSPSPVGSGAVPLDLAHRDAARFLTQATFGPSFEQISALATNGNYSSWLQDQFAQPASKTLSYVLEHSNGSYREPRHDVWWHIVMDGPDQLRQRVAFALSQIFVVSDIDFQLGNSQYGMAHYYDMLIDHAFGNYRDLLEAVTLHPVMGVYLSMVRNEKANTELNIRPDENFAREVLQLFSLGLHRLNQRGEAIPIGNPSPSYTQQTVEEFSRVFTGWNYPAARSWTDTSFSQEFFMSSMVAVEEFHDKGSKQLLNGEILPAGGSAYEDLRAALDNIFFHGNVGPFISKLLIQRLVTSNPTPEYIERVAKVFNDNGAGERGDLRAVVTAILLDDEARNGHRRDQNFGKIKEPLIKLSHFFRALGGKAGPLAEGRHSTASYPMYVIDALLGQAVMRSPSVFNFYQADNPITPGSAILAPEMQIMTEATISSTHNNYHHQIYRFTTRDDLSDDNPRVTLIDLEPLVAMAKHAGDLIDWLNLVFYGGEMPSDTAAILLNHAQSISADSDAGRFARVSDALFLMTGSPASSLQR